MTLSYSQILERGYTRLKNLDLDHEMSNTAAMSSIVRKFPRVVGEKWNEFLTGQEAAVVAKPFPTFITWLQSQRLVWERMSASDASTKLLSKKGSLVLVRRRKVVLIARKLVIW